MRDEPIINVPAALCDKVAFGPVVIRSRSCEDIVRAYKVLGRRVVGVELEKLADDVSLLSALPQGLSLTLNLRPAEAANVYTSSWLSDRFSLAVLMDSEKGLLEGVKIVTSAQIPVVINLDSFSDDSELNSALDYYLHERHLQVPIEFFHSLFTAQIQGANSSLTDVYPESPEEHLYVDESGAITGSARLAGAGKFFGSVTEDPQIDKDSALYKMLSNPKKSLFLSGSSCASCEAFDVCAGYLRLVDTTFDCAAWLQIFRDIKSKAREIIQDLSNGRSAR
jgi:hypothetical protein